MYVTRYNEGHLGIIYDYDTWCVISKVGALILWLITIATYGSCSHCHHSNSQGIPS